MASPSPPERWGTTEEEPAQALPGDDRTPHPRVRSTRANTIAVPPEQVWPWIVQMGFERAGFHSHDWAERLFGARYVDGRHSAARIHPELQDLKAGDIVPYGPGVPARVEEIEPFRHLVAAETWVLRPLPDNQTRLIARYQGTGFVSAAAGVIEPGAPRPFRVAHFAMTRIPGAELAARGFDFFISDPLHHYMESGMLKGIKKRAEGTPAAA